MKSLSNCSNVSKKKIHAPLQKIKKRGTNGNRTTLVESLRFCLMCYRCSMTERQVYLVSNSYDSVKTTIKFRWSFTGQQMKVARMTVIFGRPTRRLTAYA